MFWFLCMNSIFGLMATSGGNFVSIAHLEIPLLIKMLMCQILIFPAVYIYIRGGTVHVFVLNRHGTELLVRCMRPYDEYRQFTPNPEEGTRSNATLFDNRQRQQKNSECRELRAWKQSPLDSDHVLIMNESFTWTEKNFSHGLTRALCSCILPLLFGTNPNIP